MEKIDKISHFVFPVLIKQIKNLLTIEECEKIIFELKKIKIKNHGALSKNKGGSSHLVESGVINKFLKSSASCGVVIINTSRMPASINVDRG